MKTRLFLAALALAAPAAGRPLDLAVQPAWPTWRDRVELVIRGTSDSPCGAAAARLRPPTVDPEARVVTTELTEPCVATGPQVREPFALELVLGPLVEGPWTLRVGDGQRVETLAFTVWDVSLFVVDLPPVLLAGEPTPARVRGSVDCNAFQAIPVVSRSPDGVEIAVGVGCLPITNPPGGPIDRTVTLPALPAGDHVLRILSESGFWWGAVRELPLRVWDPAGCVPDDTTLCLHDGRFRLQATWRDFAGGEGAGHPLPLAGNDTTGMIWFFGPDNTELTVKVLEGCPENGSWWVFVSSGSTVEYRLTVTDTTTGAQRVYGNPLGRAPKLVADTGAFACP